MSAGLQVKGSTHEWRPHAGQTAILQSKARFKVAACGRRFGKALALDTPIPTPTGWSAMGDLVVGDAVFDENGLPCKVTFATEVMHDRKCYRIIFDDHSEIVADAEHQWFTLDKRGEEKVRTTEEILQSLFDRDGRRNHHVRVAKPLHFEHAALPVDPYVLGAWLGDGSSQRADIYTNDEQVIEEIRKAGYPARKRKTPFEWALNDGTKNSYKECLQKDLRSLGVLNNKHVPDLYHRASVEQRFALLQGLMDTDGSASINGWCEFSNTSPQLALDAYRLMCGLGLRVNLSIKQPRIPGRPDAICAEAYILRFRTEMPAFRLTRKLQRQQNGPPIKSTTYRAIVDVVATESVPVRCIQVDSPSRLYLAGDSCIPTHNTELGAVTGLGWAEKSTKRNPVWWVAPTYDLCEPGLDACEELFPPQWVENIATAPGNMYVKFVWGGIIEFKSAEKERTLRGRGLRGLLVEEAGEVKDGAWDILRPTLADLEAPAFIFGTPKGRNWFWKLAMRGLNNEPGYATFLNPTATNPFITAAEIEEARRQTPDRAFRQEWLAEFVSDSGGVFPNPRRLQRGALSDPETGEAYVLGWDPAKHQDYSAICIDRVRDRHTVHFERIQKMPYPDQVAKVVALARQYRAPIILDASRGSVGDPILDMLAREEVEVWPFQFTHANKQNLINNLATLIGEGSTSWPDLPVLTNELEIYEWKENGKSGAPAGWHDDAVMAKALAELGVSRGGSYMESRDAVDDDEKVTDYL